MSLIPYHPHEGREIVLRHKNALVVRDPDSQRLDIRGSACPTCHQPLPQNNNSDDRYYDVEDDSYVDPNYFRMLRQEINTYDSDQRSPSPVRRLPPTSGNSRQHFAPFVEDEAESEFETQRRASNSSGTGIEREARSQNYFKTFFVEERVLGRGGKGVVLLVRHNISDCQLGYFACKRIPVGDNHDWLKKVLLEAQLQADLSHPNLVSYRHVWLEDVQLSTFGPAVPCAFILQQYCNGGDLHHYVVGGPPVEATKEELKERMRRRSKGQPEPPKNLHSQLSFEEIYSLFKDVTSGVAYLHASHYVHRDLKPSNCLLHKQGNKITCLISDFGEVQPTEMMRNSSGATGTISYCAPEVLRQDADGRYGNFTPKSDMFSLGMILYFMCFSRLPYSSSNALQEELEDIDLLRVEIMDWKGFQDERRERPDLPSKLYTLLKKLLALDPHERPSAEEVLHAMKGENISDGSKRGDRAGGLRHRVQVIDSPAQPGSPAPESNHTLQTRRLTRSSTSGWSRPTVPERSNSHFDEDAISDGEPDSMAVSLVLNGSAEHSPIVRSPTSPLSPHRLLMPPPRTHLQKMQDGLQDMSARAAALTGIKLRTYALVFRIALFLYKLRTLSRPCQPYLPSMNVGAPLVLLAALDLARSGDRRQGLMQSSWGAKMTLILLGLHMATVWLAQRWHALCVVSWE